MRVVEQGGFSAAARACGMSPSAVSKLITRLEARLSARLVNRSTRRLVLTEEGRAFYDRATAILADIGDAERQAGSNETATGRIRLNTSASYGMHVLSPLVAEFLDRHPAVTLDIVHTDAVVDLLAERTDVAVRAGPLKSSSLVARKLGQSPMLCVAAPAYVGRHGLPQRPADLGSHDLLGFSYTRSIDGWPFRVGDAVETFSPIGKVRASDGEALRHLALGGAGIARLAAFTVRDDIASGRLMPLLETHDAGAFEAFHAIYLGQVGPVPSRVRVLLDFLAERGKVS